MHNESRKQNNSGHVLKDVLVKQICKLARKKLPENTVKLCFNWCLRTENYKHLKGDNDLQLPTLEKSSFPSHRTIEISIIVIHGPYINLLHILHSLFFPKVSLKRSRGYFSYLSYLEI